MSTEAELSEVFAEFWARNFSGYNFWLDRLKQFGGDFRQAETVKAFISSTGYRRRFGND